MAWEFRGRRRFFYLSRWRDGRVVKTYLGTGEQGELAARLVAEARQRRADRAAALAAERARLAAPDRAMTALDGACVLAIEAALTAAGYHRTCSKWRRRHVQV